MTMATNRPLLKAAVAVLQEAWPGTIPFDKLRQAARERLTPGPSNQAEDQQVLALGLLNCYMGSDLVELHGMPIAGAKPPSEKPVASPAARAVLKRGGTAVANRRHELVRLNDLDRQVIPLLDGTNDKAALVEKLAEITQKGLLTVQREGVTIYDAVDIRQALQGIIDPCLNGIAHNGLLVA
jgi:methyltransferase-like protein